jgi:IS30 family transposase
VRDYAWGKNYCLYGNFITNSWQGGQSSTIETVESIKNTYRARRGKRKSRSGAHRKSTLVTEKLFQEIPPDKRKTDLCDKAKEFCGHQELSQKLGTDFYFATPYHFWERGLNPG